MTLGIIERVHACQDVSDTTGTTTLGRKITIALSTDFYRAIKRFMASTRPATIRLDNSASGAKISEA